MNIKSLKKLYIQKKMSMMEIARHLKITHATVEYWLNKHDIKRRNRKESAYLKHNPHGDPYNIQSLAIKKNSDLYLAGLMLYWAEGNKSNKHLIALGNLDGRMIKIFVNFLRKICKVEEQRLRLYVRLYKEFDLGIAKKYWGKLLNLSPKQILVYLHTDKRSKRVKQWSKHGLATLSLGSTKLKQWLFARIEKELVNLLN